VDGEEPQREEGGRLPRRAEARSALRRRGPPLPRPSPPSALSAKDYIRRASQRTTYEEEDGHHAPRVAQELPQEPVVVLAEQPMRSLGSRWNDGAMEFESRMRLAGKIRRREDEQREERAHERMRSDQDWRADYKLRERRQIIDDWDYDAEAMEQIRT